MHQNRPHHHHGTAEGSFTAKKWFGHRAGRSPCAHSIGKFFLCYIVFFLLKLPPPARPGTTCIRIIVYASLHFFHVYLLNVFKLIFIYVCINLIICLYLVIHLSADVFSFTLHFFSLNTYLLFWSIPSSYCKLIKLDGTSTFENGTKYIILQSFSPPKKKKQLRWYPQQRAARHNLGSNFAPKPLKLWLKSLKPLLLGKKISFSLDFFTKLPRLLDAIPHNLHKLSRSMLNLGHGFLPINFNFQQPKWEHIYQKKHRNDGGRSHHLQAQIEMLTTQIHTQQNPSQLVSS